MTIFTLISNDFGSGPSGPSAAGLILKMDFRNVLNLKKKKQYLIQKAVITSQGWLQSTTYFPL